jgi:hypothetical protein
VPGVDLAYEDARVAEGDVAHDVPQRVDQRAVASPVRAQRRLDGGGLGGEQVGDHVGTAKGVDGLLRVADQHQGAVAVERALQDLPLNRVGVLELVDQHDPVAAAHPCAGVLAGLGVGQGVAQVHEEVVVVHDAHGPLAQRDGLARTRGEAVAHDRLRVGGLVGPGGLEACRRVADRLVGDLRGGTEVECGLGRVDGAVVGNVEVGGDVGDQVAGGLGERDVVVDVGGDPHAGEHLVAEAVGGGDRRGVEVGRGGSQASVTGVDIRTTALRQVADEVVLRPSGRIDVVEAPRRFDETLAYAFAQLRGGGTTERDEHQLVDAGRSLGEVADGQARDRVGLAGAGAGLQHRGPLRQGSAEVEDRWRLCHRSRVTSAASSGAHTRRASWPNRCGSSG